jgi:hypothetical protein
MDTAIDEPAVDREGIIFGPADGYVQSLRRWYQSIRR